MKSKIAKILSENFDLENILPVKDGGQSYSFKSYDSILNRDVFVKVYWYSDKYSDTLLAEPRRLSTLFNSNDNARTHIANIYDVRKIEIEEDEYLVLKMEYCGSENIGERISKSNLSIQESIDYAKQLCEGLHFLHSVNILHRDIKPENLILNNGICKLIDFGSTSRLNQGFNYVNSTSIKTLNYTPPEFFKENIYGIFSDIYQIGVVLHEMINGRLFIHKKDYSKKILREYEKKCGKKYKEFDNWEIYEFERLVIEYLSNKNQLLIKCAPVKKWIPKKLTRLIKTITNSDYNKRPKSSVLLRNQLSNLVIPDWKQISENELIVTNWKGKDYKIYVNPKKNTEWILESSKHLLSKYRKNSKIKCLDSAIKYINEQ